MDKILDRDFLTALILIVIGLRLLWRYLDAKPGDSAER